MSELAQQLPEPVRQLLGSEVLGNTPGRWALALLIFSLALLAFRIVKPRLLRRLEKFAQRTETEVDDLLADLVGRTKRLCVVIAAGYLASLSLSLTPAWASGLRRLVFIALLVQAGIWINRGVTFTIERYARRKREEEELGQVAILSVFSWVAQVAVWSLVGLLSLSNLGFNVTSLVAGLGVGGIALGLAVQNVLRDTFASLSIILDKPFEIGDFIVVDDYLGTVEKIGIKTSRLRSLSGELLVFGNDDLLASRIRNYKKMYERRVVFSFGVTYQTPADQLAAIPTMVSQIIESIDDARFDRAHFKEYGDSALTFEVVFYVLVPDFNVYMDIQQEINLALYRRFEAEGIEFAYPTRTLYLEGAEAQQGGGASTAISEA